jgi:hypothetical protein
MVAPSNRSSQSASSSRRAFGTILFTSVVLAACTDDKPAPAAEAPVAAEAADPVRLDLWSGVPALEPHPGDIATVIEPRPGPEKPPTVSETITMAFPPELPPEGLKPEVTTGPLQVERFGPTGELGLVDAIRVTFNQSMVPLASVESLATKTVPLVIEPAIPGKARWLGTRTVAFYPEGRLPYSTKYKISVPKDSLSMAGNKLAKETSWEITTPVLALASADPWTGSTGHDLDRKVMLRFNQSVQRAALVAAIEWKGGGKDIAFTEVDPPNADTMEKWERDRIVVLQPKGKLTPNTTYVVSVPAGVLGEGPERMAGLSTSFSTYPPLTLSMQGCVGPCYAGSGIHVSASTPIADPKLEDKVHVSPTVPNMQVTSWGGIAISGDFTGDTTYTVTVDAGVLDSHGQTLAKPFKGSTKLGPWYPELSLKNAVGNPLVIEKGAAREVKLQIAGLDRVEVEGTGFAPSRVHDFLDIYAYDSQWGWPRDIGKSSWAKNFEVRESRKKRGDLVLDLDAMLGGKQMAWFTARSNEIKERDWKWRAGLSQLVVVTDLGIAAAVDRDSGSFLVTRLSTGEPVADVALTMGHTGSTPVWTGKTDADGLAHATFSPTNYGNKLIVKAEHGDDASFIRLDQSDVRGQ